MTPERRKQIETLLAQITPGEWTAEVQDSFIVRVDSDKGVAQMRLDNAMPLVFQWEWMVANQAQANAAFIAAAPGIVRELLAEVERLQQVINDVWFIAESGATDYIPAEKRQELLESIARRTRG